MSVALNLIILISAAIAIVLLWPKCDPPSYGDKYKVTISRQDRAWPFTYTVVVEQQPWDFGALFKVRSTTTRRGAHRKARKLIREYEQPPREPYTVEEYTL